MDKIIKKIKSSEVSLSVLSLTIISLFGFLLDGRLQSMSSAFISISFIVSRAIRKANRNQMRYSGWVTTEIFMTIACILIVLINLALGRIEKDFAVYLCASLVSVFNMSRGLIHYNAPNPQKNMINLI